MSGAFDRNEQTIEDNPLNQWFRFRVFDRSESGVQDFSATPPRYDLDGNLLSDGRWTYSWDGENRLVKMVSVAWTQPAGGYLANATYPAITLEFAYDGLSRRVQKKTITGGTPSLEGYLYDGWNVVMISKLDPANLALPMRKWSCVWRPDVGSRLYARVSWQEAGGVGGLAWMQTGIAQTVAMYTYQSVTGNAEVHIPMMDHMGNVRHYYQIKATGPGTGAATVTGQVTANLDYDAFGREVRATGPKTPASSQPPGLTANDPWVDNLPFHFSTKFTDRESGLNYYGYRFYDPVDGRWLNRDPISERGGANVYGMALNDPNKSIYILGVSPCGCCVTGLLFRDLGQLDFGVHVGRQIEITAITDGSLGCKFSQKFDVNEETLNGEPIPGRHGTTDHDDFAEFERTIRDSLPKTTLYQMLPNFPLSTTHRHSRLGWSRMPKVNESLPRTFRLWATASIISAA